MFANDYLLTVLILILYFAYIGQAWNIMMGFAGQLSLGHALYVGLGAYTTAALYVHFGIGPGSGCWLAIPVAVAAGAIIGFLAFRFGVAGVYFAILTIAFAEFARIGFDHFTWVGGSAASSCRSRNYTTQRSVDAARPADHVLLRDPGADGRCAFVLCRLLLRSRIGYFWLAIREDEEAARALGIDTFRYKMIAVVISAGMTSLAGVFFAFYYNNLFPEQVFHISRSIELILGADHRRHRHAVRPDHRRVPAHRPGGERCTRIAARASARRAGRQAGVLRRLPAGRGDGAAGRHLAVARARKLGARSGDKP